MDGVARPAEFVDQTPADHPVLGRIKQNTAVHNFVDGLTGTHTFTGHWYGPCAALLEDGYTPGPCAHPTKPTTSIGLLTITVVFLT